ncbi:MAG: anthranilate synthase component I [Deltaproteobacteria bacterium]|nr:MAG: anthranilate synthase component I [Deltaproteobacteria bacterium]
MLFNQFPDKKQYLTLSDTCNVIPVCMEILADMETPVSLLRKLYNKKEPLFLFESVEGRERWGRYSFLGTCAKKEILVFKDHIKILEKNESKKILHDNKPLDVLRKLLAEYKAADIPELPRFWGGMIGYMTYEMVSFFEDIPNTLPDSKPRAHFMIPGEVIIFDNEKNTVTAIVISFLDKTRDKEKNYEDATGKLKQLIKRIRCEQKVVQKREEKKVYKLSPRYPDKRYHDHVKKVKEHIYQGDIIQAVISQPFECPDSPDLVDLYRAQRYINPSPYLYFINLSSSALVGSSPETMVRLENNTATLRPIAGTRPRGKTEQEDRALADHLLSDEKERAEHLMLVDLGRNDLGRIAATGSVQVTDLMGVERYSHVMHLVSNIKCDLKPDKDAWDLLKSCFPAGTLSGAPKVRAMQIIHDLEKEARGPYGGAVGYISFDGNMDLAITIRTACIEEGKLRVQAGAGIVADSDPETECIETHNKAKALEKALTLVSDLQYSGENQ